MITIIKEQSSPDASLYIKQKEDSTVDFKDIRVKEDQEQ
jgi:hypothetical protein